MNAVRETQESARPGNWPTRLLRWLRSRKSLRTQPPFRRRSPRRLNPPRGIAAIETLLAAPIVLLLGLSALQWALVFHGHQAISHAAIEGARAGSLDHASAAAIERGLARGLAPWLYGASGPEDHATSIVQARAELARGRAAGWAAWRRLSPTPQSFDDWAVTARDADGNPIAGLLEIPNDNLSVGSGTLLPASGVAGYRGTEPIGVASAQTLADANLLKIEFTYGVPLTVPLIGRMAAWLMRAIDGCGASTTSMRLGTVDLGAPQRSDSPRAWACAHYGATDDGGRSRPRWPVRVSATVRMQSPARDRDAADARSEEPLAGEPLGRGEVDESSTFQPIPVDRINPDGAGPTEDGSADRAPGFLKFGADRLIEPPGMCIGP